MGQDGKFRMEIGLEFRRTTGFLSSQASRFFSINNLWSHGLLVEELTNENTKQWKRDMILGRSPFMKPRNFSIFQSPLGYPRTNSFGIGKMMGSTQLGPSTTFSVMRIPKKIQKST